MTDKPLILEELAAFLSTHKRIPRREFYCHPTVAEVLRNTTPTGEYTWYDTICTAIPIFEDEEMTTGAWKFTEDGEVTASGNIYENRPGL